MPLHAKSLGRWGRAALEQWKKDAPKMVAHLRAQGKLYEALARAEKVAKRHATNLILSGVHPLEAQEQAENSTHRFDPENPKPLPPNVGATPPTPEMKAFSKRAAALKITPRLVGREEISGMPLPKPPAPQAPEVPAPAFPLTFRRSDS